VELYRVLLTYILCEYHPIFFANGQLSKFLWRFTFQKFC